MGSRLWSYAVQVGGACACCGIRRMLRESDGVNLVKARFKPSLRFHLEKQEQASKQANIVRKYHVQTATSIEILCCYISL